MPTRDRIVVIGAGHAGVELASSLRDTGFDGSLSLVSEDSDLPYQRPPLSKEYIKRPAAIPILKSESFYRDRDIVLMLGMRACSIDRHSRTVALSDGSTLEYEHLIFATGARNRTIAIPGLDTCPVFEVRTFQDADRMAHAVSSWKRVLVIGGGFIGLEAAGLLSEMGVHVDVVELASRLMGRAVSPSISNWFQDFHDRRGVRLHLSERVVSIRPDGGGVQAKLTNGTVLHAEAVILAAGVVPNAELAADCGLATDNGIVVDRHLSTSDPHVSAIGDCANYPSAHANAPIRLESVQNAVDQAKIVAGRLTGNPREYDALPWFWSIQGQARLQIAGLLEPGLAEIVRGNPEDGKFSVYSYREKKLKCVESVNAASDHMLARRLMSSGVNIPMECASNPYYDLKQLASSAPR